MKQWKYVVVSALILLGLLSSCSSRPEESPSESSPGVSSASSTVTFAEPDFERAVREKLLKPKGEITAEDMRQINSLCFYAPKTVEDLYYCTELESLDLDSEEFVDLTPIQSLKKLKRFYICVGGTVDLWFLERLTDVEELWAKNTSIPDITPLAGMNKLRYLHLADCDSYLKDMTFFHDMVQLEHLDLSGCRVYSLEGIERLTNLEYLSLYDTAITDLSPLFELKNLKKLYLSTGFAENEVDALRAALPDCDLYVVD